MYLSQETDLRRHIEKEHHVSIEDLNADMRKSFQPSSFAEVKDRDLPLIHGAAHGREERYAERMEVVGGHVHEAMPEWDDHVDGVR